MIGEKRGQPVFCLWFQTPIKWLDFIVIWPATWYRIFRSILIQFESNCKSIILVTMICDRFLWHKGMEATTFFFFTRFESNRWHHWKVCIIRACDFYLYFLFHFRYFYVHRINTNFQVIKFTWNRFFLGETKGHKCRFERKYYKMKIVNSNGQIVSHYNCSQLATSLLPKEFPFNQRYFSVMILMIDYALWLSQSLNWTIVWLIAMITSEDWTLFFDRHLIVCRYF